VAGQLPPGDGVADLGDLPSGDLDPSQLGPAPEASADLGAHVRVRLAAEDEVEERDRLRPDADQIVDVHGDAVDADRVEPAEALGDDHLGPHAVGGHGYPEALVDADHARVVAREGHHTGRTAGVDPAEVIDQRGDGRIGPALA